jgi:hypothetical protein
MVRIAGMYDGTLIRVSDPPKAAPASGVKATPSDGTTVTPQGIVVARFAQLGVVDHDGDVTVTGAIGGGQDVLISQWGHASWQPGFLPVGKGRVTEEGNWLVLRGRLFMESAAGRETWSVLKGLGGACNWSYGYTVPEADRGTFAGTYVRFLRRLLISECSPVLKGAGIGTTTVELSSLDPLQLEVERAALDNDRALLALQGFTAAKRAHVGTFNGQPVYSSAGGRK